MEACQVGQCAAQATAPACSTGNRQRKAANTSTGQSSAATTTIANGCGHASPKAASITIMPSQRDGCAADVPAGQLRIAADAAADRQPARQDRHSRQCRGDRHATERCGDVGGSSGRHP